MLMGLQGFIGHIGFRATGFIGCIGLIWFKGCRGLIGF